MNFRITGLFARKKILVFLLVSLLAVVAIFWWLQNSDPRHTEIDNLACFTFFVGDSEHGGRAVQSLVYLPPSYNSSDPSSSWPLILFLHGSWDRGNDLGLVRRSGFPKLIDDGAEYPFIMVAPQCPAEEEWRTEDLFLLLDRLEKRFHVDKDRIHVTGFESGGDASWNLAALDPERFATAVPFGGSPNGEKEVSAESMSRVHLWYLSSQAKKNYRRINRAITDVWKSGSYVRRSKILSRGDPLWKTWTRSYKIAGVTSWMLERQRKSHFTIRWKSDPPQFGKQVWGELCERRDGEIGDPLMGFWIYQPEATTSVPPLILFLHGSEHSGDDPQQVLESPLPRVIEDGTNPPFLVVSPQRRGKSEWDLPLLETLLEQIDLELPVDPHRLFLTGMGDGACAAWDLAAKDPWRFAAIAPIGFRPGALYQQQVHHLRLVPKWFFSNDTTIQHAIDYEKKFSKMLQGSAPSWEVSDDKYPDSLATRAYSSGKIFEWFQKQTQRQWNVQRDLWPTNTWSWRDGMASPEVVALFKKHEYYPQGAPTSQRPSLPYVYRLHSPATLKKGKTYPLIVWLHGHGDSEILLEAGELKYTDIVFQDPSNLQPHEFFMLAIQCPNERSWVSFQGSCEEPISALMEILQSVRQDYAIDEERISLVGISSGANACWELMKRHPGYFSAIAPLASRGAPLIGLKDLSKERLWVFKGLQDFAVHDLVKTVIKARMLGASVRFTEIVDVKHNCWNKAFLEHNLLSWLLEPRPN